MSISGHKLESFLKQKRPWAKSLDKLKKKSERLLIVNLIGTVILTSLAAKTADDIAGSIVPMLSNFVSDDWKHIATWCIFTLGTGLILLLWEITPKIIWVRYSENIALFAAPIYIAIVVVLSPLAWLVEGFVHFMTWITGGTFEAHPQSKVTEEELDAFIDMSHAGGAVEADERRQIKNILSLAEMTAESVMTPRVNVEFASLDMTIDQVCELFMHSSHSRIPVYGETTDDIDYIITFRDAFRFQKEKLGTSLLSDLDLEKIMKVPLTQSLDDLFEKFQKSRRHIALVLDEHGGTAGVVTMEDVLEEVFGDIKDEKDQEEIYIRKRKNGSIEAVGTVLMDDILEEYDVRADEYGIPQEYTAEPLSYVIMAEKEEFPTLGEEVTFSGPMGKIILRVLASEDNVIEKVECERK